MGLRTDPDTAEVGRCRWPGSGGARRSWASCCVAWSSMEVTFGGQVALLGPRVEGRQGQVRAGAAGPHGGHQGAFGEMSREVGTGDRFWVSFGRGPAVVAREALDQGGGFPA